MPQAIYLEWLSPEIGAAITDAVRKFAAARNLTAEVWVHDLPLWFLRSDESGDIIRRLQVGAYRLDASEEIRAIPQVFRIEAGHLLAFERVDPTLIRARPLAEVRSTSDVMDLLHEAWDLARQAPAPASPSSGSRNSTVRVPISPHAVLR